MKTDKEHKAKPHAQSTGQTKTVSGRTGSQAKPPAKKPAHADRAVAAPAKRGRSRRLPAGARDRAARVFARFAEIEPEPKGELEHADAFTLLVAVVLSAQATDAGVNKATRHLFAEADTPERMVAIGEDRVRELIKTIGLYRNKAKNVIALSQRLIADFGGEVPDGVEDLESLPGVGRKTANVVLNVWFGRPTMAVDTHVFRVSHRLGLTTGKTPEEVERDLLAVTPEAYGVPAHHWLILHGRYLCKARRPECWRCPVADLCPYKSKTPAPNA